MKAVITMQPDLAIPVIASTNGLPTLPDYIQEQQTGILEQLDEHGAVLFRGFGCEDADHFSKVIELCGLGQRCDTKDYDLPRTILANDIYTSSDLPAHVPLPLHHEKPRSQNPPHHLYFCCVTPATKGGGTVFANAEVIWLDMPKIIQDKLMEHGVMYRQFFHGKTLKHTLLKKILTRQGVRSWSEYFGSDEQSLVEEKLRNNQADWRWVNRDLIISTHLPGVLTHPLTRRVSWFNSSAYLNYYANLLFGDSTILGISQRLARQLLIFKDMFPMICHYGNGQAFSSWEIAEINRVIQQHARVLYWQKGDFMIVDNIKFMHGKEIHEGNRLLYSCMTTRGMSRP